ncbi:50S ribosomal protein L25 [Peloplasma aerotolerans]|uniref:50S ribosomal protein L25 n=1 Tax=Peloplasma aerotolerans TaxID=3044389 RepID=A0AAW6U656_9MOLU|nr:50S ribosomal protein L25 [Mariniplasma sp. M4Ah]MDI6452022.1 50S ribosomal protein L25 [Mariniplasma sp. M4Ah]MDR4969138.1 50S ribosomal protein L25 [Acholeplasmataceae bacterium]
MKLELRTQKLREVRKQGYVPGVMYGKSIQSTSVQALDKDFKNALKEFGTSMTFKAKLDGKTHNVYIKNFQSNILKPSEIIHFDLHRVTATEKISAHIRIELIGKEQFHDTDVYPDLQLNEIVAEYVPGQGMSHIDIDVSNLVLGDVVYVKDLVIGENVTLKEDPDKAIVVMKEVHIVEEEEVTEDTDALGDMIREEQEAQEEDTKEKE